MLGRIEAVDLRDIWTHERYDFSEWLARPENIELLGEEIGMELTVTGTEQAVGRYSIDLVAEEEQTGRRVIIENQLELTDHDHLGKIITYASGWDAEYVIWIVRDAREEHQQAMDWLNEHTRERLSFFLIRMELWRIGNSAPAPKFHVLSQPNNWGKTARSSAERTELTDTKQQQLAYWTALAEVIETGFPSLSPRKPKAQHWYSLSIGRSRQHISLTVNSRTNEIACELYLQDGGQAYERFLARKEEIEQQLGVLEWMELPDRKASRIKQAKAADFTDASAWSEQHQWLAERAAAFRRVLGR